MYAMVPTVDPGLVRCAGESWVGADCFHAKSAGELGETEIKDLHRATLSNEYVCRFDVAVDDAFRVRGVKGVGKLNADIEQAVQRQRTGGKLGIQTLTFKQLH